MRNPELRVTPIPAFNDNYIWLLETGTSACAVVDPGDHRPVVKTLEERGLELDTILVTHHHADHIGGVPALLERWPARVVGPDDSRIRPRDITVGEGDRVSVLGLQLTILEVPGHTSSHIAYVGHGALFCGDTLFSVGCGRLFEGSPGQMQASLDKLAGLPAATRVYCAHEYTQSNCNFARAVEPHNTELEQWAGEVAQLRAAGQITLPTSMGMERAVNPFLRTREPGVVAAARAIEPDTAPGAPTMAVIRAWKDRF